MTRSSRFFLRFAAAFALAQEGRTAGEQRGCRPRAGFGNGGATGDCADAVDGVRRITRGIGREAEIQAVDCEVVAGRIDDGVAQAEGDGCGRGEEVTVAREAYITRLKARVDDEVRLNKAAGREEA